MPLLTVSNDKIVICLKDKILAFNIKHNKVDEIQIPPIELPPNLTKNQQDALKNEKTTAVATCFSKCGTYFAVCCINKQLVIYDNDFKVVKNLTVNRTVSKIRFSPSGDVVVADKTGDVYLYKVQSEKCEAQQLLGHLSMLLDVVISECEKYIVTCDRDEKIRVSEFPGSFNIVSFCLGHEEFVLNVEFFNPNTIVSSSGDGTIRFWNYLNGELLKTINTNEHVSDKSLVQKFSEFMDSETVEVESLPITNMKLNKTDNGAIIVVSLYNYNALQVYSVTDTLDVKLLQIISFDSKLLSFDLCNYLYVLKESGLDCYEFKSDSFNVINKVALNQFYDRCKDEINDTKIDNISVLYKRKYDNVQEYQERKKLRIENKKK